MVLTVMLTIAATGNAMSYEQARNEALFLTDKMAYELNLTDEQYEAAYEINLDYLMGVTSYDDVYSTYWERRNLDMSYVLLDWQWNAFCAATYFYRPLYWSDGFWHFGIYARYPHRDYFFFGRPVFYASYRGGHAWHRIGGHGYYYGRRDHFRPAGRSHFGMLDRWNRGDFRGHHAGNHSHRGDFGGSRNSSTRTTVNHGNDRGHRPGQNGNTNNGNYGNGDNGSHGSGRFGSHDNNGGQNNNGNHGSGNYGGTRPNRTFGNTHSNGTVSRSTTPVSRSTTPVSRSTTPVSRANSTMPATRASSTMSTSRSSSMPATRGSSTMSTTRSTGSFGGSRSGGSFSGSRSGGSHSGGSRSGGSHSSGSFGSHR